MQVSTSVTGGSGASTTLPPGVIAFGALARSFETLIERENLAGTLPYSIMPQQDVLWLFESGLPMRVTEAKGYRLANGDLAILFFTETVAGGMESYDAASEHLTRVAKDRYPTTDEEVVARIFTMDFGYVLVSRHYQSQLQRLARMARTGEGSDTLFNAQQ
jgi:hypothetical protein